MSGLPTAGFEQSAPVAMPSAAGARDSKAKGDNAGAKSQFGALVDKMAEGAASVAKMSGQFDQQAGAPGSNGVQASAMTGTASTSGSARMFGLPSDIIAALTAQSLADSASTAAPLQTTGIPRPAPVAPMPFATGATAGQAMGIVNTEADAPDASTNELVANSSQTQSPVSPPRSPDVMTAIASMLKGSGKPEQTSTAQAAVASGRAKSKDAAPDAVAPATTAQQIPVAVAAMHVAATTQVSQDRGQESVGVVSEQPLASGTMAPVTLLVPGRSDVASESIETLPQASTPALRLSDVKTVAVETHMMPVMTPPPALQIADAVIGDLNAQAASAPMATSTAIPVQANTPQPMRVLQISLEPPGLGQVTVQMRLTDGRLDLEVHSSGHDTLRVIEADKDKLTASLTSAGYSLDKLVMDVSASQSGTAGGQGGSASSYSQGDAAGRGSFSGNQNQNPGGGSASQGEAGSWSGVDGKEDRTGASGAGGLYL